MQREIKIYMKKKRKYVLWYDGKYEKVDRNVIRDIRKEVNKK